MRLLRRVSYFFRRRRADEELAEELAFHRAQTEAALQRSGEVARDAARVARRIVGNTALAREDARAVWMAPWLEALWQDVRHGFRSLRRSPGLVIVSALSLGLGIGLNTILYQAVTTVYRHQPTMADPESMVGVEPGNANQFSYPDYRELLASGIFADVLGFRTTSANLRMPDVVTPIGVLAVSANFFEVLGADAQIGRTFSAEEAAAERDPRVVVITNRFWRGWLESPGGHDGPVGETLTLNGETFTVVGVLPDSYRPITGWVGPDLYVPLSRLIVPLLDERGSPLVSVMARLRPGSSVMQAQAAVTAFGAGRERAYPERSAGMGRPANVYPADLAQFRGMPGPLLLVGGLLWAGVALVLIIGCVNVMGLLMAWPRCRSRSRL